MKGEGGLMKHEAELLAEIDASIATMRRTFDGDVLSDNSDIIAMRVARMVADLYMYDPALIMTESFRLAVVDRISDRL